MTWDAMITLELAEREAERLAEALDIAPNHDD